MAATPAAPAACVALVKVCSLQAAAALLQGPAPDEAAAAALLTLAAEAAVRGSWSTSRCSCCMR